MRKKRKSKKHKGPFAMFLKLKRKGNSKANSKNKVGNKVAPVKPMKNGHSRRHYFKLLLLKTVRNVLVIIGLILICFTFFFEVKTVNISSDLFNKGKELVLIEKWPLNSVHPIKLPNNSTIMLNDSSVGVILANWENTVFIEDNSLVIDGIVEGELPTSFDNNRAYFLSDNEYLILLDNYKVAVVNTDMIKGEVTGRYNITKFNNLF